MDCAQGLVRGEDTLHLSPLSGRGGQDEMEVGDGIPRRRIKGRPVEHMHGAAGRGPRALLRPAVAGRDETQLREPEVRHGPRRHADVLGELRLDQDDGGSQ
jgi:hypothetical protein